MKKKGAIELSMTTVIVIVLGIVLLSLGLIWVRNIFGQVGGVSDDAFNRANDLIGDLESFEGSFLTVVPDEIEISQGGDDGIGVVVNNEQETSIIVTITMSSSDPELKCGFLDGRELIGSTEQFTLDSGKHKKFTAGVKDLEGDLRTTSCKIKVLGTNEPDNERTLIVTVKKQSSLFG